MELSSALGIGVGVAIAVYVAVVVLMKSLVVVGPDQVVVASGRAHRGPDGTVRGYRVLTAGRHLLFPVLETGHVLDRSPLPLELSLERVHAARCGLVDLRIAATARITDGPDLHQAVERFLDRPPAEVAMVARQTLAGVARAVAVRLTTARLRDDRRYFEDAVQEEALSELAKLGLDLDGVEVRCAVLSDSGDEDSEGSDDLVPGTSADADGSRASGDTAASREDEGAPPWAVPRSSS